MSEFVATVIAVTMRLNMYSCSLESAAADVANDPNRDEQLVRNSNKAWFLARDFHRAKQREAMYNKQQPDISPIEHFIAGL